MTITFQIVSTLVAIGFLWSVVLFILAIVFAGRRQEAGFVYSVVGAVLYLLTYCDRIIGLPLALRTPFNIAPGGTVDPRLFHSATWALVLLAATYALRMGVYFRLILAPRSAVGQRNRTRSGRGESDLNDLVSPALAFLALSLVVAAAIQGTYDLPTWAGILVLVCILALYMVAALLPDVGAYLVVIWRRLRIMTRTLLGLIRRILTKLAILIARLELIRRRDSGRTVALIARIARREELAAQEEARKNALDQDQINKEALKIRRQQRGRS